jgi:hypothetical protein
VLVNHIDGLSLYGELHMYGATTIISRWGCISAVLGFVVAVFPILLFVFLPVALSMLDAVLTHILETRTISALFAKRQPF